MKRNFYFALGRPFSPIYTLLMRTRERCYRSGLFRSARLPVPVLSVGNLTLGGTGKTPVVQHLARMLRERGYRPAVISRGYGGATREPVNVVSDGREIFLDAVQVGDEPRMLAENLPGVPVLTGVVRKLPARHAVEELGADVLILDDGFQHLGVARDLDLVLFNGDTLAGNSRVFPGGDLREPVAALHRCHGFVLTGIDSGNRERAERFADLLRGRFGGRPVFFTGYRVGGLVLETGEGNRSRLPVEALAGRTCLAFCGIAQPERFGRTVERLPVDVLAFQELADHHHYRQADVERLVTRARELGADCLLTTEKDLAKLQRFTPGLPVYALEMRVDFPPDLEDFVFSFLGQENS